MKQNTWEYIFMISFIIFGCLFFIGTLQGSTNLKWLPYAIGIAFLNLGYWVYKGTTESKD